MSPHIGQVFAHNCMLLSDKVFRHVFVLFDLPLDNSSNCGMIINRHKHKEQGMDYPELRVYATSPYWWILYRELRCEICGSTEVNNTHGTPLCAYHDNTSLYGIPVFNF